MKENGSISRQTLQRLPLYLSYLKELPEDGYISATGIADALDYNHVQVRKDLASVSHSGRPKVGYATRDLIRDIERSLGYDATHNAVLVGAGKLSAKEKSIIDRCTAQVYLQLCKLVSAYNKQLAD